MEKGSKKIPDLLAWEMDKAEAVLKHYGYKIEKKVTMPPKEKDSKGTPRVVRLRLGRDHRVEVVLAYAQEKIGP